MNCREFDELVGRWIEGSLDSERRSTLERHITACSRCLELKLTMETEFDAVLGERPVTGADVRVDLTAGILERTTGPVCPSAHVRLPGLIDGALAREDAELVALHLERCFDCRTLASVLSWLRDELPGLIEVEPEGSFVADVMAVTRRAPRRWRDRVPRLDDVRGTLAALAQRPRFAFEAAYVGAMVLWLLFGTSLSPFSGLPERAMAMTRFDPAPIVHASVVRIPKLVKDSTATGERLLRATGGRVIHDTRPARQRWSARWRNIAVTSRSLGGHGIRAVGEAARGEFDESSIHLKAMGSDAWTIWRLLWDSRGDDVNHELKEV